MSGNVIALLCISGVIALGIVLKMYFDCDVMQEELQSAEWIIRDFCNQNNSCDGCSKYNKEQSKCGYCIEPPYKWG